jgi:ubiquinone/menaquinone biosynthesis C-methylase UbiE
MIDPKKRFSDRVEHYIKYRPHYPTACIAYLKEHHGFHEQKVVVDIGSGTGISTELFLRNGNKVFGVEPNKAMREAGERMLAQYKQFVSVEGTAEATTLPKCMTDVVVAGQAFHWFDRVKAKREFQRIANEGAIAVVMWNDRTDATPFMRSYEALIQEFAIDYREVDHKNIAAQSIQEFFGQGQMQKTAFSHQRMLDLEGIKGLLLSASYMPNASHPAFSRMMSDVESLFAKYQRSGVVRVGYLTRMYCGKIR